VCFWVQGCVGPRYVGLTPKATQAKPATELHVYAKTVHKSITGRVNYAGDGFDYRTFCKMRLAADNWLSFGAFFGTVGTSIIFEPIFLSGKDAVPAVEPSAEVSALAKELAGAVTVVDQTVNYPDASAFISDYKKKTGVTYAVYQTCDLEGDTHRYSIGPGLYTMFDVPSAGAMVQLYQDLNGKPGKLLDYREIIWADQLDKKIWVENGATHTTFEGKDVVNQRRSRLAAEEIKKVLAKGSEPAPR
jgi:hypothetical protein